MRQGLIIILLSILLLQTNAAIALTEHHQKTAPAKRALIDHLHLAPGQRVLSELPTWSGSFTDFANQRVKYTMVGGNPAKNAVTIVPVYIIPVRMVYGAENGNTALDPATHIVGNGLTVIQNVKASPLFDPTTDYSLGGTDVGRTEYIDAYQRANFWRIVSKNNNYHVMLGEPLELPELEISVANDQGSYGKQFGKFIGTMDQAAFDQQIVAYAQKQTVLTGKALAIFVSFDVYLTIPHTDEAIGGYHSAYVISGIIPEAATYAYATYVDKQGAFGQDVSSLSHEIAEWMDNPFTQNRSNCSSKSELEVADPLEFNPFYGTFAKKLNGFTYHLQSLAFLSYFGAPTADVLNGWTSFQGPQDKLDICSFTPFEPTNATSSNVRAINAEGQVAGEFSDETDGAHGFVRNVDGSFSIFDAPDADPYSTGGTEPKAINAGSVVAGVYTDSGEETHSFIRGSDGSIIEFDPPGSLGSGLNSINDAGYAVGRLVSQDRTLHGFMRSPDGEIIIIDVPNGSSANPTSINDENAMAGTFWENGASHGFLRGMSGNITVFDVPKAKSISVAGISSDGTVGGTWFDGSASHGFLRSPQGTITVFNVARAVSTSVSSMNDRGELVGTAYGNAGLYLHGFDRKTGGTITTFDGPAGWCFPLAISSAGQIAGESDQSFLRNLAGDAQ